MELKYQFKGKTASTSIRLHKSLKRGVNSFHRAMDSQSAFVVGTETGQSARLHLKLAHSWEKTKIKFIWGSNSSVVAQQEAGMWCAQTLGFKKSEDRITLHVAQKAGLECDLVVKNKGNRACLWMVNGKGSRQTPRNGSIHVNLPSSSSNALIEVFLASR